MSFVSPSTDRTPLGCYDSDCASGDGQSIFNHTNLTFEFSQGKLRCHHSQDKGHCHNFCTSNFIIDFYGQHVLQSVAVFLILF